VGVRRGRARLEKLGLYSAAARHQNWRRHRSPQPTSPRSQPGCHLPDGAFPAGGAPTGGRAAGHSGPRAMRARNTQVWTASPPIAIDTASAHSGGSRAPKPRLPVAPRNEGWAAAGESAGPDRPTLPAANRQRSGFGYVQRRERKWERVLLTSALIRFAALACAPLDLRRRALVEATASSMHSWGSRGRRFKSGRPDW
jgi:hypothetical protein